MRWVFICGCLCASAPTVMAQTNVPDTVTAPVPDTPASQADAALKRIQEISDSLADLEGEARAANQLMRADCIAQRLRSALALLEVTQQARQRIISLTENAQEKLLLRELQDVAVAAERAQSILTSAKQCDEAGVIEGLHHPPVIKPRTSPTTFVRRPHPAKPGTGIPLNGCLRQARFACLLRQAMELHPSATSTNKVAGSRVAAGDRSDCVEDLTKRGITPLDGWETDRCVTLDTFAVTVVRALQLKPDDSQDPKSYLQALRDEGLPVDTLLPAAGSDGTPPLVTEAQAVQFLSLGYAAPLPSSRPITPF